MGLFKAVHVETGKTIEFDLKDISADTDFWDVGCISINGFPKPSYDSSSMNFYLADYDIYIKIGDFETKYMEASR